DVSRPPEALPDQLTTRGTDASDPYISPTPSWAKHGRVRTDRPTAAHTDVRCHRAWDYVQHLRRHDQLSARGCSCRRDLSAYRNPVQQSGSWGYSGHRCGTPTVRQ